MEMTLKPPTFNSPESMKCPKCARYGKGPIVRESGEVVVLHRISKPTDTPGQTHKRSVYCVIREKKS